MGRDPTGAGPPGHVAGVENTAPKAKRVTRHDLRQAMRRSARWLLVELANELRLQSLRKYWRK